MKENLFSSVQSLCHKHIDEKLYSVIREINVYSQYVHAIDERLNHVVFNVLDTCKHDHFLTIYIPEDYPMCKKQSLHFDSLIPSVAMNSLTKVN